MAWSFDPNHEKFKKFTDRIAAVAEDVAQEAVEAFVDAALPVMIDRFEETSEPIATPTGRARVARGGNGPGRVDTGHMVGNMRAAIERTATSFVGKAGWLDNGPQDPYFLLQENGFQTVEGAHALERGFQAGREAARRVIESRWSNR